MRDPARIDRALNLISVIWHRYPDQRLGQLLINYAWGRDVDVFNREDDDTLSNLRNAAHARPPLPTPMAPAAAPRDRACPHYCVKCIPRKCWKMDRPPEQYCRICGGEFAAAPRDVEARDACVACNNLGGVHTCDAPGSPGRVLQRYREEKAEHARLAAEVEALRGQVLDGALLMRGVLLLRHGTDCICEVHEDARAWLASTSTAPAGETTPGCTGTSASWCPVCGDCTCPESDRGGGERTLDDVNCPLHSPRSKHTDQEAIPHACGHAPPYGCPGCGGMTCIHTNDRWQLEPREAAVTTPEPTRGTP